VNARLHVPGSGNPAYTTNCAAGKPKKVAIVAALRKLIIILNSMIRTSTVWNPRIA
jgi:transposase